MKLLILTHDLLAKKGGINGIKKDFSESDLVIVIGNLGEFRVLKNALKQDDIIGKYNEILNLTWKIK